MYTTKHRKMKANNKTTSKLLLEIPEQLDTEHLNEENESLPIRVEI